MRRFLLKAAVFLAIQIALAAWVASSLQTSDPASYMAAFEDKTALLARADEPNRVILVGGSNTAWGLNAVELGQTLGHPVVNAGLHAALGLRLILDYPAAYLHRGDLVVLSLEYEHYDEDTKQDAIVWASTPYLKKIPIAVTSLQPVYLSDHFLQYVATAWGHRVNMRKAARKTDSDIFAHDSFDARGDFVAHYGLPPPLAVGDLPFEFANANPDFHTAVVARLNDFIDQAQARGARVVLYFPPLPTEKFAMYKTQLVALDTALRAELRAPILNHPGELVLADADFYNTVYHLTKPGVEKRNADLAARLRAYLAAPPSAPTK